MNPELRSRASASRSSAVSVFTRRRSFRISSWSSGAVRSVTSRLTTTFRCLLKPPTGRRARNPAPWRGSRPGALDEILKPMVAALLRASRGRHGDDHRPFPHAAHLLGIWRGVRDLRWSAAMTTTRPEGAECSECRRIASWSGRPSPGSSRRGLGRTGSVPRQRRSRRMGSVAPAGDAQDHIGLGLAGRDHQAAVLAPTRERASSRRNPFG